MSFQMSERVAKIIVILWYLVGIAGFMIRPLEPLFQSLTPIGILGAATVLLYFHQPRDRKSWFVFAAIPLFGFVVEVIGVNTQLLFGFYEYGNSLGPKLWNTPLSIGINWLILIYCISAIAKPIRDTWYFPVAGAIVMVTFDWLMEPVAIATDMWFWALDSIPVKNYTDWFLVSGFLFLMIRILKIEINNPIAKILFLMQLVFFLALNILFRI